MFVNTKMSKRNFTFLLSVLYLLLSFHVHINAATQDYIRRDVDIDRSAIPKNILFGSFVGGRSHLKPMLDIAAILIEKGYNITLLTSGKYTPSSEYPAVKQISMGPQLEFKDMKNHEEVFHKEFNIKSFEEIHDMCINSYNSTFEKYKNVIKDYDIDLIVCYITMNDACLDVAHALKKPVVGFITFVSSIEPKTYKSDPVLGCTVSLENESFLERFKCTVTRPIRILYQVYPFLNKLNDIRKQMNIEPIFLATRRLSQTSLILIDSFFGFELPQSLPPNIQEIGPVLSEEYPPLTPELSEFINTHKRVLYVSFGTRFFTTAENNNKLLQSFVEIINKNLIDGVIWALVHTSKDNFPHTLSLTNGTQFQTSPILNNENPHIRIVNFAPQFSVLNHINTKLFLSHGGAGSSHESLYTSTPMLILPFTGDQLGNAEKLKLSGVALTLNKLNLNVDDIINKIDFLLKDENVKKNSKRMEILAKINSKRKYRAADSIEYILHNAGNNDVNEEFLKEWIPADVRMGFIKGNNYDVYGTVLGIVFGIIVGILWIILKLVRFFVKKMSSSDDQKSKRE